MAVSLQASPWLAPWESLLAQDGLINAANTGSVHGTPDVYSALNGFRGSLLQRLATSGIPAPKAFPVFVPHNTPTEGEGYEAFIHRSGQVPTRDNLHDLFNGLVWLRFPQAKAALNRLHVQEIARLGHSSPRGPLRDALTVFDENAAFLQAPDALWNALVAKDWHRLFVTQRALWQQSGLVLFGHALLEKLTEPRKGITAHVYRVAPASSALADWDAFVARDISAEKLATKPFAHLPVLGVPGWWPANETPDFYADASVFRPPR